MENLEVITVEKDKLKNVLYEFSNLLHRMFCESHEDSFMLSCYGGYYPFQLLVNTIQGNCYELNTVEVQEIYGEIRDHINHFLDELENISENSWNSKKNRKELMIYIYLKMRNIFKEAYVNNQSLTMENLLVGCFKSFEALEMVEKYFFNEKSVK